MGKFKEFLKTTLFGGLGVVLPTTIIILVFAGVFRFIAGKLEPLTNLLFSSVPIPGILADIFTAVILILTCFFVGLVMKTGVGKALFRFVENELLKKIPGYNMINETIAHFTTAKQTPFSQVATVRAFEGDIRLTGFVTDKHGDGSYTIFVPTGPNPTSGNILHVAGKNVTILDVSAEAAMKSIIGCGAGSKEILENTKKKMKKARTAN